MLAEEIMTILRCAIFAILLLMQAATPSGKAPEKLKSIYDYSLVSLDGKEVSLSTYKGKVVLIVNLASKSIYKDQLAALEELQKSYADKGLAIVGIPSSDFGREELADNTAIRHYYVETEHVNFAVFAKSALRGKDAIPLAHYLTDPKEGIAGGEFHWNFTKFVVDRQGKPVLRFEADTEPSDPEFHVVLEKVLDGSYKKKDAKEGSAPAGDEDEGDGE
jgi:glutathione peroxidase